MKPELLILTACIKPENIPAIQKSIGLLESDLFNFHWVIGYDVVNIEYIPTNMYESYPNTSIYEIKLDKGKHYGGDIYNPILHLALKDKDPSYDPWIYILDDDNIIHPLFPDYFEKLLSIAGDRRIAWMTDRRGIGGYVDEADQYMQNVQFEYYGRSGYTPRIWCPDPSQVLIKLSLLKEVGGYGGGFDYDFKWFTPLLRSHQNEIVYFHEIDPYGSDRVRCYWNGLRTNQDVAESIHQIRNNITAVEVIIEDDDSHNHKPKVYSIRRKETAEAIFKLIKSDIEEDFK